MTDRIVRSLFLLLLITALLFLSAGCGGQTYEETTFFAMDTPVTLRYGTSGGTDAARTASKNAGTLLKEWESLCSAHDPDSALTVLNETGSLTTPDERLAGLIEEAVRVSGITNGAFDPTLGPLIRVWNISGGGPVPGEDAISEALAHTGCSLIRLTDGEIRLADPSASLDLGAIAKGAAADALAEAAADDGVPYGLVSFGSSMTVFGEKPDGSPYKIGIRDPDDPASVLGYITLTEGSLSVSGDYERYFEEDGVRYHHILDPGTGTPARSGLRSVAVLSPSGADADALSTALFVLGADQVPNLYNDPSLSFEAVLVTGDRRVILTNGLDPARFTLANSDYSVETLPLLELCFPQEP